MFYLPYCKIYQTGPFQDKLSYKLKKRLRTASLGYKPLQCPSFIDIIYFIYFYHCYNLFYIICAILTPESKPTAPGSEHSTMQDTPSLLRALGTLSLLPPSPDSSSRLQSQHWEPSHTSPCLAPAPISDGPILLGPACPQPGLQCHSP